MSHIVVGVDGSTHAERALRWAVKEAQLRDAEIELVHGYTLHVHGTATGDPEHEIAAKRLKEIGERNKAVLDAVKWSSTVVPLIGAPTGALLDVGADADLIVVGSRGLGGFSELFLGATSYRTAAQASVPVAVIRGAEQTEALDGIRALVVGVDGSRTGLRALRWAIDEAQRRGVGLTAVHAYAAPADPSEASVAPREELERLRELAHREAVQLLATTLEQVEIPDDIAVERVVEPGSPAGVLLSRATTDHLLVVGTRGQGVITQALFGSVSHQILHHAAGPVVVVP